MHCIYIINNEKPENYNNNKIIKYNNNNKIVTIIKTL